MESLNEKGERAKTIMPFTPKKRHSWLNVKLHGRIINAVKEKKAQIIKGKHENKSWSGVISLMATA